MSDIDNGEVLFHQDRYIGEEKAAIRMINMDDPEDVKRMIDIANSKRTNEFVEGMEGMDESDVRNWVSISESQTKHPERRADNRDWQIVYAVSGSPDNVKHDEVGELQGFINFYTDQETRDRVRKISNDPKMNRETQIVEIGLAKWPDAPSRQMASGIRQAALEINKLKGKGVDRMEGKYSAAMEPTMVLTAFIDPKNHSSMEAFTDAGFENQGLVHYDDGTNEDDEVYFYRLNWEKLNQKMHEQSDKLLFMQNEATK
jgi:hypothetical protein